MNQNHTKSNRFGTRALVAAALLLALLIAVNLIVGALPSSLTVRDTSPTGMYTLSATSRQYLSALEEDITVYYVCQAGAEIDTMKAFAERLVGHSRHLTLKTVDPTVDTAFAERYGTASLSDNSLVIESGRRFTTVAYSDMYYIYNAALGKISSSDFQSMASNPNYYQYFTEYETALFFQADALLMGAIEYVTAESVPMVYVVSGHGDVTLSQTFLSALTTYGVKYKTLNLAESEGVIPADASCLILHSPTTDLSEAEAEALKSYLAGGGNLFLTTDTQYVSATPRLLEVMKAYGLGATPGPVYEGDSKYHIQNAPYNLYAKSIDTKHPITAPVASSGYPMLMPVSHGIAVDESLRSGLTVTPLFRTGDTAYLLEGEEKHSEGTRILGVAAEEGDTRIVWLASANALTDAALSYSQYGNLYYFGLSARWSCDTFISTLPTIEAVDMTSEPFAPTTAGVAIMAFIGIVAIPVPVLIVGWSIRKKRRSR